MSWLRIDDRFARHPKVSALTDRQFRTHVEVMCWCADYQTDGVISDGTFSSVKHLSKKDARRFVELGLWDEKVSEVGAKKTIVWTVHDWKIYNATTTDERVAAYLERYPDATANEVFKNVGGKRAHVLAAYNDLTASEPGTPVVPEQYPSGSQGGTPLMRAQDASAPADPDPGTTEIREGEEGSSIGKAVVNGDRATPDFEPEHDLIPETELAMIKLASEVRGVSDVQTQVNVIRSLYGGKLPAAAFYAALESTRKTPTQHIGYAMKTLRLMVEEHQYG